MTWSTRRLAIFCAPWIAVRTARSHSSIATISPSATPRERVLAAPITRKAPWRIEARAVLPSPTSSGTNCSTRQETFEVPMSRTAMMPRRRAVSRRARIARWIS